MSTPVLAFADYTKDFLLETDASKEGQEVVLSQKQAGGQYHPVAYGSQALTTHEKNYHATKLLPGTETGHDRTVQGILAVPTLLSQN